MINKRSLTAGLVVAAALLTADVALWAQLDGSCNKAAFFNTENQGQREGCGSSNGCHWRECMQEGGGSYPGNYADQCGTTGNCQLGDND
jgi:hypothetical protein